MKKKLLSLSLALGMSLTLAVPALAVDPGFAAGSPVTRGTLAQVLYEMEGKPDLQATTARFEDAQGEWYAGPAVWCKEMGLYQGDQSADFHGEREITRGELATVLYRYAQMKGMDVTAAESTNILSYDDAFDLPSWSVESFQWAMGYGILDPVAVGNGMILDYSGVVTRGELAQALDRMGEHEDQLSLWVDTAPAKAALMEYMAAITDKNSPDFIPVEDRVAVFDMDGTFFNETDPYYFDHMLLYHRVVEDPSYKDKASAFEKEVAEKIRVYCETGVAASGLEMDHGRAVASAFAGMTVQEFYDYIDEYKKTPMPGYEGMTRGEAYYQPMLQVIDFLKANDFQVYVISGTDRFIVRGLLSGGLDLPFHQMIGSDVLLKATNQGDKDGLDYLFTGEDQVLLGGEFLIKNLKMNKVKVIAQEIGKQPVLSFGNSSGDYGMANYVVSNNPHRSAAFMLCCDDLVRENGNTKKADSMRDACAKNGWVAVSMRDDWTTIYGEGVTRK